MVKAVEVLKEVISGNDKFKLRYTLLEYTEDKNVPKRSYGYKLDQYYLSQDTDEEELIESVETRQVFYDYMTAEKFFIIIIEETVFPQTLLYHIDDWFFTGND